MGTSYWAAVHFIFGATVGSFLNVCIWRLPRGESVLHPPSHCPACDHRLHLWPDMVPLLSQLWQRGRCRYCRAKFSWRYCAIEALTGALWLATYLAFRDDPWILYANIAFISAMVVVFFIDFDHYLIHEGIVYIAIAAGVVKDIVLIQRGDHTLMRLIPGTSISVPMPLSVISAIVAFWLLWSFAALMTALLNREAMGSGDAYLLAAMGANLFPWTHVVLGFFLAALLGTVGGLGMQLVAKRAVRTAGDELDDPPDIPTLTSRARWGRLLVLAGAWLLIASVWLGLVAGGSGQQAMAFAWALIGVAAAAGIVSGARIWLAGDREWLHEMDELFEDSDPGPRFIPFGPYLVLGTLIALFWGDGLIAGFLNWYLDAAGL